jgi:hypothetical protein
MSAHTPGPWYWDSKTEGRDTSLAGPWLIGGPESNPIISGADITCREANARLIAAAPDLLEAAKLVITWYEAEDKHEGTDFYQRRQMYRDSKAAVRAAIAKATGDSHAN